MKSEHHAQTQLDVIKGEFNFFHNISPVFYKAENESKSSQ